MTTARTMPEIQQEYSSAAAEILSSYHNVLDEIKEDREPEAGAYLDRLSDEQRAELLREQKERRVDEERARALEEYTEATERYQAEVKGRASRLRERLYKVENTTSLANAATADEEGPATSMLNRPGGPHALQRVWRETPAAEALERQVEGVETIIHRPSVDSLMPSARVGAY